MRHIKNSPTEKFAFCGETKDCSWVSPGAAVAMADCATCLSELFSETCSTCGGTGIDKDCDDLLQCPDCGIFGTEDFIADRDNQV